MNEWNKEKLDAYILNKIEENQHLEYKSAKAIDKSDDKKKEISITVSSMANADGGTIIYGMKEYDVSEKRHLPEKIDPIDRQEFSKEWLEQVINSNIYPTIQNLVIHPLTIESITNGVVYVIEVPKSFTAHQAKDWKYYQRHNFTSVPLYDHQIRDIQNRVQTPKLTLEFIIEVNTYKENQNNVYNYLPLSFEKEKPKEPKYITNTFLRPSCRNIGKVLAKYVNCYIEVPTKFLDIDKNYKVRIVEKEGNNHVRKYRDNTVREVVGSKNIGGSYLPNLGPARYDPILPGISHRLDGITLTNDNNFEGQKVYWTIHADNAEPMKGECYLKDIEIVDVSEKSE